MQENNNTILADVEEITVELLDNTSLTVSRQQNNTIVIRVAVKDMVKSLTYSSPLFHALEMLLIGRPFIDEIGIPYNVDDTYRFTVRGREGRCDEYYLSIEEGSKLAEFLFTMGRRFV